MFCLLSAQKKNALSTCRDRDNQAVPENEVIEDQIDEMVGVNKSDKRNMTEENGNAVPSKRPKITAIEILQNENTTQPSIKLTEANNEVTDVDESREDNNSCDNIEEEEEETGNTSKEKDKILFHNEQNQPSATSISSESKMEVDGCELSANVNGEKEEERYEQSEDLRANQTDKTRRSASSVSAEEAHKRLSERSEEWEEMDADILESLSLFHDEVND